MNRPPYMCIIVSSDEKNEGPAGVIPRGFSYVELPSEGLNYANTLAATIHNSFDP